MAKFICNLEHGKLGILEVLETANGARVYAKSDEFGVLNFQSAAQQKELRSLVIAAGHGDDLKRKPNALEVANFAPETAPAVSVSEPEKEPGADSVSVSDKTPAVSEQKPQNTPETKKSRIGFGWGRK